MSKHIYALRMCNPDYLGGQLIEDLFVYESDNQVLTIDDFVKINSSKEGFRFVCYFYGGVMTIEEFTNRYPFRFRTDLVI
jgi:hypothetical protein